MTGHSRAYLLKSKRNMGIELTLDEKWELVDFDLDRDPHRRVEDLSGCWDRYENKPSDWAQHNPNVNNPYCLVDRDMGYVAMEAHQKAIDDECEREYRLSHGMVDFTDYEYQEMAKQIVDFDPSPVVESYPLPSWLVATNRITKLLGA